MKTKLLIFLILICSFAKAQNDQSLVSYFAKDQLEVKENHTVFNVFKLENRSNQEQNFQVSFTAPSGWVLFGENFYNIKMMPGEKKSLPIRLSPSNTTKGGIGYALNATLVATDGRIFATKYCFLTVPVRTDIFADFVRRNYYLDHSYGRTKSDFYVKNNGNSDKLIVLNYSLDDKLNFSEVNHFLITQEVLLAPGQDTTFSFSIRHTDDVDNISYYSRPINVDVIADDTLIKKSAFIRYLNYRYDHYIPETDMPLILEVSAMDLLSDVVSWRFLAMGKIIFSKNRNLQYFYQSQAAPLKDHPNFDLDDYYVKYNSLKHEIKVGNFREYDGYSLFGKGLYYKYNPGKFWVSILGLDDYFSDNLVATVKAGSNFKTTNFWIGYTKMFTDSSNVTFADIYNLGFSSSFANQRININSYYNDVSYLDNKHKQGLAILGNYSLFFKKFSLQSYLRYGSPYYVGYYRGVTNAYAILNYRLHPRHLFIGNVSYYQNTPSSIYNNYEPSLKMYYHSAYLHYQYQISSHSFIYGGPVVERGVKNYYENHEVPQLLLEAYKGDIGYRYSAYGQIVNSASASFQMGYIYPREFAPGLPVNFIDKANTLRFSLFVGGKNWGVHGMYYNGFYNMSLALSQFYGSSLGKVLYFMPYGRLESKNKKFYYELRFSYLYNIDLQTNRASISQMAGANLNRGWNLRLQNTTSIQSFQTANSTYRYTNNYMEFVVRKVFNFNQPGQKYHDLKTVFYRDLNGNRIKDNNEPGIENVIHVINNASYIDSTYHHQGEMFGNVDLASNGEGMIVYKDIPRGKYEVVYQTDASDIGQFSILENKKLINLNRDTTIYVPFVERNKVYGRVVFNQLKISAFGDIPLENIRVSITDSKNNVYYGLTDKNGYYEIFAPSADFYTVQIVNNLWSDYFTLRQNKFIIKFNGYKTFEVNFEFDENKREIRFDDVTDISDIMDLDKFIYEDVTQIKQTILRGSIKDEKTLDPVKATILVKDLSRESTVIKVQNDEYGDFNTTFISGKNYLLQISAKGYWIYQENLSDDQLTTFEVVSREGLLLHKIKDGEIIDASTIIFAENDITLSSSVFDDLNNIVKILHINDNINIVINGYASPKENNPNTLSLNRANVVFQYLVDHGIDATRLMRKEHGANKEKGRRVELSVSYK